MTAADKFAEATTTILTAADRLSEAFERYKEYPGTDEAVEMRHANENYHMRRIDTEDLLAAFRAEERVTVCEGVYDHATARIPDTMRYLSVTFVGDRSGLQPFSDHRVIVTIERAGSEGEGEK